MCPVPPSSQVGSERTGTPGTGTLRRGRRGGRGRAHLLVEPGQVVSLFREVQHLRGETRGRPRCPRTGCGWRRHGGCRVQACRRHRIKQTRQAGHAIRAPWGGATRRGCPARAGGQARERQGVTEDPPRHREAGGDQPRRPHRLLPLPLPLPLPSQEDSRAARAKCGRADTGRGLPRARRAVGVPRPERAAPRAWMSPTGRPRRGLWVLRLCVPCPIRGQHPGVPGRARAPGITQGGV